MKQVLPFIELCREMERHRSHLNLQSAIVERRTQEDFQLKSRFWFVHDGLTGDTLEAVGGERDASSFGLS